MKTYVIYLAELSPDEKLSWCDHYGVPVVIILDDLTTDQLDIKVHDYAYDQRQEHIKSGRPAGDLHSFTDKGYYYWRSEDDGIRLVYWWSALSVKVVLPLFLKPLADMHIALQYTSLPEELWGVYSQGLLTGVILTRTLFKKVHDWFTENSK